MPSVIVPVLSNKIWSIFDKVSSSFAPLIRIPSLDALPIPQKYPRGTDITNAHGHDVTINTSDLYRHSFMY